MNNDLQELDLKWHKVLELSCSHRFYQVTTTRRLLAPSWKISCFPDGFRFIHTSDMFLYSSNSLIKYFVKIFRSIYGL